jgi:cytochrome c oxidase subunit 1
MPRRIADYPDAFADWNWWSSLGSYVTATGTVIFIGSMLYAYFAMRQRAAENPWGVGATTLEWKLPSPPAFHSYERLPKLEESGGAHH